MSNNNKRARIHTLIPEAMSAEEKGVSSPMKPQTNNKLLRISDTTLKNVSWPEVRA